MGVVTASRVVEVPERSAQSDLNQTKSDRGRAWSFYAWFLNISCGSGIHILPSPTY